MDAPPCTTAREARARHDFDMAKLEADSWAHIIAQDTLAANESGDWSKLPSRGMLQKFKAAKAVLAHASDVLAAVSGQVAR